MGDLHVTKACASESEVEILDIHPEMQSSRVHTTYSPTECFYTSLPVDCGD